MSKPDYESNVDPVEDGYVIHCHPSHFVSINMPGNPLLVNSQETDYHYVILII